MSGDHDAPTGRRAARRRVLTSLLALALSAAAACSSDEPRAQVAPGEAPGVPTTPPPPTTLQDLEEIVGATDRPAVTAGPPGDGADVDVTAQVRAVAESLVRRNGPYTGSAAALVDALADEVVASFAGCDVAPRADTSVRGADPAVATIAISFGCDDVADAVRYAVTLVRAASDPGSGSPGGWEVSAATRTPHCSRGVSEGLCV